MSQRGENVDLRVLSPERLILTDAEPIFLVGCPRSGTTALLSALREGAGIPGFKEGNFPALLAPLIQAVRTHYQGLPDTYLMRKDAHLIANVEREWLEAYILNYFATVYREFMGPGVWVDKSANGESIVRSCPLLAQIFPKARFIFCKRRGIENVLSRQRKFPNEPFRRRCEVWDRTMRAWLEVKPRLRGRHVEVDQRDSAIRPGRVVRQLRELIPLDDAQAERIEQLLRTARPEQTRTAQDTRPISLTETGWSEGERAEFEEVCGEMMAAFGYDGDDHSGPGVSPIQLFFSEVDGAIEKHNVIAEEWGFRRVGANGFQLHPNPPGEPPAEIRYPAVVLAGHGSFSSTLKLGDMKSEPVRFTFSIEEASGGARIVSYYKDIGPGGDQRWEVAFKTLYGAYDIVLSTEMTPDARSSNCARAQWLDPTLD